MHDTRTFAKTHPFTFEKKLANTCVRDWSGNPF